VGVNGGSYRGGEFEVQQQYGLQIFRLFYCRIRNRTVSLQKWLLLHFKMVFLIVFIFGGQLAFKTIFFLC